MDLVIHENALDRPTKVIKANETESIECSNCNKELLKVKTVNSNKDSLFNIIVECPFCNDKSFAYEVKGLFYYIPVDNVLLINTDQNDVTNTITIKTKKRS